MMVANVVNTATHAVHLEDDVVAATRRLMEARCGLLPVVVEDEHGARVVGLFRDRDAFAATYGRGDMAAMSVGAAMSPAVCTCRPTDSLGLALRLLRKNGMDALPVVNDDGYLVGVLSFVDLMQQSSDAGLP